uniref:Uncharacterized protein n=1 Tax=Setaria viridis TaxID=4556 RepID=A0A4U6U2Y2_SETVI|nr:hypothetical protein SEVIR_7G322500v2 [Setaria viridis]
MPMPCNAWLDWIGSSSVWRHVQCEPDEVQLVLASSSSSSPSIPQDGNAAIDERLSHWAILIAPSIGHGRAKGHIFGDFGGHLPALEGLAFAFLDSLLLAESRGAINCALPAPISGAVLSKH